ncbi:ubiquitin-like domain-containing protein CIP73 isoform X1 [Telopea speciosissima]|uniref:ubiquitin-like domain-containing protein CIP73 isoform X1 n=1 Tax=Telopea speciosissima TaxID=54955 RepID=UPI001CC7191D|nr:ubiquitin-like domain-containing protein CIP73 isoform X1 [Telopea speciosissima]
MADENSSEIASTSEGTSGSSESTVELNVKTLDSKIYAFLVDRNISVPLFKEKIANAIGVPVEQQRLIFRGKVLKDDHLLSEYHLEDGHTLHLVARQPAQSQPSPGTGSGETNGNSDIHGNDGNAGAPRNQVGQVSHSVVLGTFNLGDQGDGVVPDLTRIVGAVLSSIGLGNQTLTAGTNNVLPNIPSDASGQASQGVETEGTNTLGARSQTRNQVPSMQTSLNHSFPSLPQSLQFPMTGGPLPLPSLRVPIPDSLITLCEFMNRMEQALSLNVYQSNLSPSYVGDPLREVPSDTRGLPTPQALAIVVRRAQQLLSGHATSALAHIAGRLEGERASADPAIRSQIQTESVQVGLAMQHLGALLLELGRTMLTLRMGQSPAESVVNAGPAVYISPSGPNPIMVQPFPFQTSSLFAVPATSANQGNLGTFGPGDAPRNVNIHIHAGAALAPGALSVATRASTGERNQGERPNGTGSGDSGPARVLPVRNIVAAAVPSGHVLNVFDPIHARSQQANPVVSAPGQGSGVRVSNAAHAAGSGLSVSQPPPESLSLTNAVGEINAHVRNLVDNMRSENQAPSGQSEASTIEGSCSGSGAGDCPQECMVADEAHQANVSGRDSISEAEGQPIKAEKFDDYHHQLECRHSSNKDGSSGGLSSKEAPGTRSVGGSSCCPSGESTVPFTSELVSENVTGSSQRHDPTKGAEPVPLGLGLGGLRPKRRSRMVKSQGKDAGGTSSAPPLNQNQETIASGQQLLQSLLSRGSNANRSGTTGTSVGQLPSVLGQIMGSMPLEGQGSNGQVDATSAMSQVLNSPALNSLLAGVSEQAGIGSPGGLRNMLEQFTQNPAMRNTLDQIAQQIESQDIGNMFSGSGTGQGGGMDLSRMLQQMMPIVSQALTGSSTRPESLRSVNPEQQPQCNERRSSSDGRSNDWSSEIDLQQAALRIEHSDPSADVFHSVVENAVRMYSNGNDCEDLVEELCSNSDLANEFMEMLHRSISRRLQLDSGSAD